MNILYHHRTQGTGAEGVHISRIIKGLHGLGHKVSVVCPSGDDPLKTAGNNPFTKKKDGFKKKVLSFISRHLPQFLFECLEMAYNFSAYPRVKNAVEAKSVDLIYERYAFFMTAGAQIAKEKNIPFIVEVNEIAGPKRVRKQVFVKKAKAAERFIFMQADAIIVVSSFLKQEIVGLGINAEKIFVIPNGADDELFDPKKYDRKKRRDQYALEDNDIVLGFIAFSIGQNFHKETLFKVGKPVIWISVLGAICPLILITFGSCREARSLATLANILFVTGYHARALK